MTNKYLILLFYFFTNALYGYCQVTIGSVEKPQDGAILQFKNIDGITDGSANATKGLMLPRVNLAVKDKLSDILSSPTNQDNADHIGLTVYNTNVSVYFCPGIYVWSGEEWKSLVEPKPMPDVKMTDSDGNSYNAKWYGSDCRGAYWTSSNLYSTKNNAGVNFNSPLKINPAKVMSLSVVDIANRSDLDSSQTIEYKVNETLIQENYLTFTKKFGLLYNWDQAKNACPTGWHLATVDDWNILAEMLYATVDENNNFLSIGEHFKADNSSYTDTSFTGYNAVEYNYGDYKWGGDNTLGFAGYPSGAILTLPSGNTGSSNFGIHSYWWTSDAGNTNPILRIDQGVHFNSTALYRGENYQSYYFNVRCVKDK